jgi:hypothetical protein
MLHPRAGVYATQLVQTPLAHTQLAHTLLAHTQLTGRVADPDSAMTPPCARVAAVNAIVAVNATAVERFVAHTSTIDAWQ